MILRRPSCSSTNSVSELIETAASSLCSLYASYLKENDPNTTAPNIIQQQTIVRKIKKTVTSISYPRPIDDSPYSLTKVDFAAASKGEYHGQEGVITGLHVGQMKDNAIFHTISRISHKSKIPVKSGPTAEIIASAEAVNEAKTIFYTYSKLEGI